MLGQIDLAGPAGPVDLGHLKQRSVLAVLAVEANRTVSRGALIERVWGPSPPRSASNLLYGYLGRLRSRLTGIPGIALVRRPGGYALAVPEERIDLHRFRRAVAGARATPAPAVALRVLEDALAGWRGEAFAGVIEGWLPLVRQALVDERLAAVVHRNELALAVGEHDRLLPELRILAREHPGDERVLGQLMVALHRRGRTGEALSVFALARRRSTDELGLDPGQPLRRLAGRILREDPALLAHAGATS